jgi:hypothetical protein
LCGQERAGYLGEFAMLVGQCDTHEGPSSRRIPRAGGDCLPRSEGERGGCLKSVLIARSRGRPGRLFLFRREPLSGVQP